MPDRIRVLFAIGSLAGGGSERQVVNILRHLDRSQFEPHLYLISRTGEFLSQVPDDVEIAAFNESVSSGGIYFPGRLHRMQVSHLQGHLQARQIDVLYDRTPNMTLITSPACRRTDTPRLSTIVCDTLRDIRDSFDRFRWIKTRLLKKAYQTAYRTIGNSLSLSEASRIAFGIPRDRIVTISNGFYFDEIARLSECPSDNSPYGSTDQTFNLVTVGRLHPQKGFDQLLKAIHEVRQRRNSPVITLTIVGQGPEHESLARLVDELSLSQQVRFTGFQSNPYPLLRSADLFCLSSRYEGMPNVLVEAMSLGVPVLSTDCPHGPRDILQGGELGTLVSNLDVQSLADGIEQAMKPDSAREDRTVQARESVLTRFGISPTTEALENLLIEAARGTPQAITRAADARSTP